MELWTVLVPCLSLRLVMNSSYFLKAVLLRRINMKLSTTCGLARRLQPDQGASFLSKQFKRVQFCPGFKNITSSAYHPDSQGSLERNHELPRIRTTQGQC